jgi:hypothetical protein
MVASAINCDWKEASKLKRNTESLRLSISERGVIHAVLSWLSK